MEPENVTCAMVCESLKSHGFRGEIEWEIGTFGKVMVYDGKTRIGPINVSGFAVVPTKVQTQYGHGMQRLSCHPLYPAPTENQTILRMMQACKEANSRVGR